MRNIDNEIQAAQKKIEQLPHPQNVPFQSCKPGDRKNGQEVG